MRESAIKISVVIPTYKRPLYLSRAIKSVLNQTYRNLELIIVDDNFRGNDDQKETEKLVSSFNDKRIKYISHEINKGGSVARNTGIFHSSGKYITFLDDDDEYLPNKLEEQLTSMEKLSEDWVACYTLMKRYRGNSLIDISTDDKSGYLYLDFFKNELYINAGSNLFVRADIVKKIGGFDESFKRMQDLEFAIRVAEAGKIHCVQKHLLKVNMHDNQMAVSTQKMQEYINHFFYIFENRIYNLAEKDSRDVIQSKYLDSLKVGLMEKDYSSIKILVDEKKISWTIVVKFIIYLIKRKLTKKCFGYKF